MPITIRSTLSGLLVRKETFLPVQLLLGWFVDSLGLTVGHWHLRTSVRLLSKHDSAHTHLATLLVGDALAVWSALGLAARAVLHLAAEGVGHPHIRHLFGLVVPNLLTISAVDLRDNELDSLGNQLTLLPSNWLTGFIASPDLSVMIVMMIVVRMMMIVTMIMMFDPTCLPSGSVSQRVTQFCLVTFLHSGNIFTWGIIFRPCSKTLIQGVHSKNTCFM